MFGRKKKSTERTCMFKEDMLALLKELKTERAELDRDIAELEQEILQHEESRAAEVKFGGYCAGPEHDFTPRWKTADGKFRCYWCGIVEGTDEGRSTDGH